MLVRAEYVASERFKTINQTSMEALADRIVAAGVRSVTGRVVGVDTYFDQERWVPEWPESFHFTEAGPLGALMVNDGAVVGQPMKPDDPAVAAVTELAALLAARGVTVGAGAAHDVLPEGTTEITSVASAPVSAVVQEMLVDSDNNTAEILLKQIGLKSGGAGSTKAGLAAVSKKLKDWGIDAGTVVVDGSGLSALNKVSCASFAAVLDRFKTSFPDLLATAGETGTLETAFVDSPLKGIMKAKTGTLNGVKALAGYVPVDSDDPVRFVLLLNKNGIDNKSAYRPVWNSMGTALAKASAAPRSVDLAP